MTDKELRKLKRIEILELLLEQSRENERLRAEIEEMKKKLEDREIAIKESGSIAEAALKLNGIFEAAQKAADQYLENLKFSLSFFKMNLLFFEFSSLGIKSNISSIYRLCSGSY